MARADAGAVAAAAAAVINAVFSRRQFYFAALLAASFYLPASAQSPNSLSVTLNTGETLVLPRSRTNSLFAVGLKCVKEGNYQKALQCFEAAIAADKRNAYAYYYSALCLAKLGDRARSLAYLQLTSRNFAGSDAGRAAARTLKEIGTQNANYSARSSWSGRGNLPKETWIPFTVEGSSMVVDGIVNGVPVKMIFDTGAESCIFSLKHLKQFGLSTPQGKPSTLVVGVGKDEPIPAWIVRVNLKVGRIEKYDFPVMVADMPVRHPLLGQQFFNDFAYSVDNTAATISFKSRTEGHSDGKKPVQPAMTVNNSGKYVYSVPFRKDGQALLVTCDVNGRKTEMVFDTGAELTLFSEKRATALALEVDRRRQVAIGGVAGATSANVAVVRRLKLGPVERIDMPVLVTGKVSTRDVDGGEKGIALLGQDFFSGWHYKIDERLGTISFIR